MKKFAILVGAVVIASVAGAVMTQSAESGKAATPPATSGTQASSAPAPSTKPAAKLEREYALLKQLVGEWDMTFKLYMQPDQPPVESKGTDSVRTLGDHWVISEMKTTMMGGPYNGVMSLGFDEAKNQVHGTYIDSFGCVLWVYKGSVNEAGDTLTLDTEGPSLQKVGATAKYREVIQITGKDTRTFNSSTQFEDGKWVKIVTIEYSRRK